MKKIFILAIAAAILALGACGQAATATPTTTATPVPTVMPTATPAPTAAPTATARIFERMPVLEGMKAGDVAEIFGQLGFSEPMKQENAATSEGYLMGVVNEKIDGFLCSYVITADDEDRIGSVYVTLSKIEESQTKEDLQAEAKKLLEAGAAKIGEGEEGKEAKEWIKKAIDAFQPNVFSETFGEATYTVACPQNAVIVSIEHPEYQAYGASLGAASPSPSPLGEDS